MARMRSLQQGKVDAPAVGPMPVHPARLLLLGLGAVALLAGLWGGLVRLGVFVAAPSPAMAPAHGPLMVSGFLGTVIALERAVALGRPWAYAAPLGSALGAVLLLAGLPTWTGALAMSVAGVLLALAFFAILRRLTAVFTVTMALGALAWLGGNLVWLSGGPLWRAVSWWITFFVLTIAGERLELSRLLLPSTRSRAWFVVAVAVVLAGLGVGMVHTALGARLGGVGLLALTLWLARHDIARRTARHGGLPRFIATCILSGYLWLGMAAALLLRYGGVSAGPMYDAVLHAVFLGFVFGMIFAHAPIIIPAVTGRAVPYRPHFYVHLGLLHLSLAARLIGDLAGWLALRQLGGTMNVAAVLLFLLATVAAVWAGARQATEGR